MTLSWFLSLAVLALVLLVLAISLWTLARYKLSRSLHIAEMRLQMLEEQIRRLGQEQQS